MSAEVIPFPVPEPEERSCFLCEHASLGPVTYCSKFKEEILHEEVAAEDCEEFERDPFAT